MAWTAVVTHATGDVFPASDWNTYVRDNLTHLHGGGGAVDLSAGAANYTLGATLNVGTTTSAIGKINLVTPVALTATLAIYRTTDAQPTLQVNNDGSLNWGPGGAAVGDVTLSRSAVNNLTCNGAFNINKGLVVDQAGTGNLLYIGSAFDTYMGRSVAGQLGLNNKLIEGNPVIAAVTVPTTFTPNLSTGLIQRVQVNAGGANTLTIGAPTNPPSGTQTALLVVHIANFGGGTITIAWNAVFQAGNYLALPASEATSKVMEVLFVWDGGNWRIVSEG